MIGLQWAVSVGPASYDRTACPRWAAHFSHHPTLLPYLTLTRNLVSGDSSMTEQATTPRHVLVTGSTGAIGQPLIRFLQGRGHTVRGLARRPTPGLTDYVEADLI